MCREKIKFYRYRKTNGHQRARCIHYVLRVRPSMEHFSTKARRKRRINSSPRRFRHDEANSLRKFAGSFERDELPARLRDFDERSANTGGPEVSECRRAITFRHLHLKHTLEEWSVSVAKLSDWKLALNFLANRSRAGFYLGKSNRFCGLLSS